MDIKNRETLIKIMVEDGIVLNDKGNYYVCKCPFHDDSTASFVVYKNNYLFTCFGCGEKGDVIDYVSKTRDISFGQAVRYLDVEYENSKFIKKRPDMLQLLSDEEKKGVDVSGKYGKDFIDSLLAKKIVDMSNEEDKENEDKDKDTR